MTAYRDIVPRQLRDWFEYEPDSIVVLDVREPFEIERASISPSLAIPLGQLEKRMDEVPEGVRIVCLCHHGMRSAHACMLLAHAGKKRLYNLKGGIEQWSCDIDPAVPRY